VLAEIRRLGTVDAARGLRIARVEPVLLSYTYAPDEVVTWSGGTLPGITAGLVRVVTEDGLEGVGETYAGVFAPEVVRALVNYYEGYLLGADASHIAALWDDLYTRTLYWGRFGVSISVLSGVESALWDLCGKAVGKPVHELLGTAHERLPRYASGGMGDSTDRLELEQAGFSPRDFRGSKIRAGRDAEADAAWARSARDALDPSIGLAVDAVQGSNPRPWTAAEAIAAGRALEPLDLLWYEEPCAATDVDGYVACRRALHVPIAGGESCTTLHEFRHFIDADALDLVQPDAAHVGGLLETRKVAAAAEARGVDVAVHAWASGGCVMANYHAGFASPNCTWLEYPTQPNPLIQRLLAEPLEVEDGYVRAPRAPGLGIALTPELEAEFPYRPDNRYFFAERRA
jgi:L-alanine-DL-glutamate epimerase-like enolase superfamily enzyme